MERKQRQQRQRVSQRQQRVRARVHGTAARPRLAVFRSNKHFSAQLIDDDAGTTVLSLHDQALGSSKGTPVERAATLGEQFAERARKQGITAVVFDRRAYHYHGRVRAFADAVRKNGLTI